MGETNGRKGYFSRFVCTDPFWHQLPVSSAKNILLFLVKGGHLSHGRFYDLLLGRRREVREPALTAFAVFQVSSAQNNQYAEVAYFGVACSESLQSVIYVPKMNVLCIQLMKFYKLNTCD